MGVSAGCGVAGPKIWVGPWCISIPSGFRVGNVANVWGLANFFVELLLFLGVALALIFVIVGGIKWSMSSGDKQALASAKATTTFALIGLVLLLSVFFIVQAIQNFYGVKLVRSYSPPAPACVPSYDCGKLKVGDPCQREIDDNGCGARENCGSCPGAPFVECRDYKCSYSCYPTGGSCDPFGVSCCDINESCQPTGPNTFQCKP